jgi:curved DNA-binding protein CbpA
MTYGRAWRKEVMVMAAADRSGPVLDLYQLLGVSREAPGAEITQAWRRRALAEHPDRRPRDATAPARFRALAEAYRVLGDPARRAAYDRRLRNHSAVVPQQPLRAGPVWVDIPPSAAGLRTAEAGAVRLAVLAELAARYLASDWGRPW